MNKTNDNFEKEADRGYIFGRNAVLEAIRSGREIDRFYVLKGNTAGALVPIIEKYTMPKPFGKGGERR